MKSRWVVQALLLTFGCVLLIATMTRSDGPLFEHSRLASAAVFHAERPMELHQDNLVDGLSSLVLPVPIARVDLNGNILAVDLKVIENRYDKAELYRGIAEMISFSFERTTNIDQLLLRLVAEDRWLGTRYLLLAADVRRGEWPDTALEALRSMEDQELTKEMREWFRITETHLWKGGSKSF